MAKNIPAPLTEDSELIPVVKTEPINQPTASAATFKPSFQKTRDVDHHVAKLLSANSLKNKSYKANGYIPVEIDHAHIWHNITSQGHPQEYAVPKLGHTHLVTVVETKDGFTLTCGPAVVPANIKNSSGGRGKRYIKKQERGSVTDMGQEVEGPIFDEHTHEIQYIKSEKVAIRI